MPKTFDGVEKSLVYLIMAMAFLHKAIGGRYNVGWPIFIHLLQTGTCSAMCFAYCFAEWIKEKRHKKRLRFFQNGHADKFRIACYEYIKRCQCILCRRHRHSHAVQRSCHVGSFNGMYWHFYLSTKTNLWTYCCSSSCQVKQKQLLKVPLGATDCGNRYCILQPKTHVRMGLCLCRTRGIGQRHRAFTRCS